MQPRRPQAFTLIELLVVISIIALLVGILLPALGAARRQAMLTQCLAQQRSLAQGGVNYTIDNKDFYPYHQRGPSGGFVQSVAGMWHATHVARDPYPGAGNPISASNPEWTNFGNLYKPGVDIITTPETFYCPSAQSNVSLSRYILANYPDPWGSENLPATFPGGSQFVRSSYLYLPYLEQEGTQNGGSPRRFRKTAESPTWVVMTMEFLPVHALVDIRGDKEFETTSAGIDGRVPGSMPYTQVDASAHVLELDHWFHTDYWAAFNYFKNENDLDKTKNMGLPL